MTTLRISARVEAEANDGTLLVRIRGGKALHPDTHLILAREVIAMHTGLPADHFWPVQVHVGNGDAGDVEMNLLPSEPAEATGRRALRDL